MIKKLANGKYRLFSKDGKRNLGTFSSREEAEKHERAVQYFKRHESAGPIRITAGAQSTPCVITADAADGDGKPKLPTFEGMVYTGATMRVDGYADPIIIDLDGVKPASEQLPALHQHDHLKPVGHTSAVTIRNPEGIHVAGVFSGHPNHVAEVVEPGKNKFPWQMSVGADPITLEFLEQGQEATVNGRQVTGPLNISRETLLKEASFVPLGADGATSAEVTASRKGNPMNPFATALKACMERLRASGKINAAKYSDEAIDKMDENEAKAALKEAMAAEDEPEVEEEDEPEVEEEDEPEVEEEEEQPAKAKAKGRPTVRGTGKGNQPVTPAGRKFQSELRQIAAKEQKRQSRIVAMARKHGIEQITVQGRKVDFVAHAIEQGWSISKAELTILRAARPGAGVGVPGGLFYSTSAPQMSEAVLEAAALHALRHQLRLEDDEFYYDLAPDGKTKVRRISASVQRDVQREFSSRYPDQVQQTAHTAFKGRITLQEMFAHALRCAGITGSFDFKSQSGIKRMLAQWHFAEEQAIRAEGASNLSVSNILANVMNKFALQGYLFFEQSWRDISAIRPVSDFKPTKSINLLSNAIFKKVGSTGELQNFELSDQAFANQAEPYGIIGTIPYTHLVNDDLSIFSQVPLNIGTGAGEALNDTYWSVWFTPGNGDDGNAFWRTTSDTKTKFKMYKPNKLSGGTSALSSTALQLAKALLDNQVKPTGTPLGLVGGTPRLLFGPSNWQIATELLMASAIVYGGASASRQPNVNVWGSGAYPLKPVMTRYMENANYGNTTTGWYLILDPAALPVVEVAFLNGVDTPAVLQAGPDYQFDRLGISLRGTMEFGVKMQNFRGGVESVGA